MTNKEFYGAKLLAITLGNTCNKLHKTVYGKSCMGKMCEECEFNDTEDIENWLNAEHVESEPPLLKNGDGLNTGDWIMVRDYDDECWGKKRQFLFFRDGMFYTTVNDADLGCFMNCLGWKQARLPMEGE